MESGRNDYIIFSVNKHSYADLQFGAQLKAVAEPLFGLHTK